MSFIQNYKLKSLLADEVKFRTAKSHVRSILRKQQHLYEAQTFCDVILIAGTDGTTVPAHKVVLSASSDYFLAMFDGALIESGAKEVTIGEVNGAALKALIDFMYSGSIELCNVTVELIFKAADLFRVHKVGTACVEYMLEQLEPNNCLGVAFLAEQYSCKKLYDTSFTLACSNFKEVCTGGEFLELNEEQVGKFLSSDNLCLSSEEEVFHSLVSWVKHKPNRKKLMLHLLSHVRFPFLKPSFILENRNSVCESPECEQLLSHWVDWHKRPSENHIKPRRSIDKLALVSMSILPSCFKLQTYNSLTDEWSCIDLPTPTQPREINPAWIYANNKLIAAGGRTKSVECLDLRTMKWNDLPPMRDARAIFSMAELNGQLYVIGGGIVGKWNPKKWWTSVERYDFYTSKWQMVAPLRKRLGWLIQVAVLNGLLYAIGDRSGLLVCYDPVANKWSKKAYKNEKSTMFGMAAAGKYLYILGGRCNGRLSSTVERYDPATNCWTTICPLRIERMLIKCITVGNRLIACGGTDGERNANIVEEYNDETKEWRYLAPMQFFRNYYCCPIVIK